MLASRLAKITAGKLLCEKSPDTEIDCRRISTDSRRIRKGDFFLALKGDRHDGNRFVEDALLAGAAGAIVERPPKGRSWAGKTIILPNGRGQVLKVSGIQVRNLQIVQVAFVAFKG